MGRIHSGHVPRPRWASALPNWPGPKWVHGGPKRPKITKNGARHLRDGHWWGPPSVFMGRIHLGNVWVAFSSLLTVFWPQILSVGPIFARLGPSRVPRSRTESWPHLGLDGPNCNSDCFLLPTPTFGGWHPLVLVSIWVAYDSRLCFCRSARICGSRSSTTVWCTPNPECNPS